MLMSNDHRIVLSETDFARLRRLASHPRLAAELKSALIVDDRHIPSNVVTVDSKVRFEDETTGERRSVTIVLPARADVSRGMVSVLSTVGTALLGLAEGQTIAWAFPDGSTHRLRVLKIIRQPQEA